MAFLVPIDHVTYICKLGQGEKTCAFLTAGGEGMECAKGTPFEEMIRDRLLKDSFTAKGDNCSGAKDKPWEEQNGH